MKKNGFTIVELLASIVILTIIITIGVGSINVIKMRVLQSNYESKKALIELKAEEYTNDTGYLYTNVGNLIQLGYLTADNSNEEILNPLTNKSMNCFVVKVNQENSNLYGTLTNEEQCDNNALPQMNVNLGIKILNASNPLKVITEGDWINQDVILELYFINTEVSQEKIKKIVWKNSVETKEINVNNNFEEQKQYPIHVARFMDTTFYAEVIFENGLTYNASVKVKVDKQKPIIYKDEIKVYASGNNTNTLAFKYTDLTASGGKEYYIGTESNCNNVEYQSINSNSNQIFVENMENKKYYICLKDAAGNVSNGVEIDMSSYVPPTITNVLDTLTLEENEEYNFKNNVQVGSHLYNVTVSCNPTVSKMTGEYDVTCIANSDNGLSSSTTFHVEHKKASIENKE